MSDHETEGLNDPSDDPCMAEAAADVCRIAAWIEHHHPDRGAVMAFAYDYRPPEGGTVVLANVYQRDATFKIDRELSRLATRAAWVLGWPLPSTDRGLPVTVPDHRLLSHPERLKAIQRLDAAMAATSPEILERPIRMRDAPLDSDMSDFDMVAAWLDHRHPGRITSVIVQDDYLDRIMRDVKDGIEERMTGQERRPAPGDFKAVRVETVGRVEDPALAEEAARALVALGWRQDSVSRARTWSQSWAPAKMTDSFKAQAVERVEQALAGPSAPDSG